MSLRSSYHNRSIRVAQFAMLWAALSLLLGVAWWAWLATADQQIYTLAQAWHALGLDDHVIPYQGKAYSTGWVVATIATHPELVGGWVWWMVVIPVVGLALDIAVFVLASRPAKDHDTNADHLRGARVVDAKTIKRSATK